MVVFRTKRPIKHLVWVKDPFLGMIIIDHIIVKPISISLRKVFFNMDTGFISYFETNIPGTKELSIRSIKPIKD